MNLTIRETAIPGCFELAPPIFDDERGRFVKTYHKDAFAKKDLCTNWMEEYYSVSREGVLRGMHFQSPPHDHEKMVYCTEGVIHDVVLDLRKGSPTYGKHAAIELSAKRANQLYIPRGLAHGFCVLSKQAAMHYKVSSLYAPEHDSGILWNSAGITWPTVAPNLSDRDKTFVKLEEFDSPFIYEEAEL